MDYKIIILSYKKNNDNWTYLCTSYIEEMNEDCGEHQKTLSYDELRKKLLNNSLCRFFKLNERSEMGCIIRTTDYSTDIILPGDTITLRKEIFLV